MEGSSFPVNQMGGSMSEKINSVTTGIAQCAKVVREIMDAVEQYCRQVDETMKKDLLKRIQEKIEKLQGLAQNLHEAVAGIKKDLTMLSRQVDGLVDKAGLQGFGETDRGALKAIQNQLNDLTRGLGL